MLVLSRKKNESIVINGNIRIEVLQIKGKQIRIGITAPASMKVLRGELPVDEQKRVPGSPDSESHSGTATPQVFDGNLHELVSAVMTSV